MGRSARKAATPDLGILAARLLFGLQGELFRRMAELGYDDLQPRHGAVLAYLDDDGTRQAELTRLAGRNKQTIGAILDELEKLGYVYRAPDPSDRRTKLIVPTERGRAWILLTDDIIADIEKRHAAALGPKVYTKFIAALRAITAGDTGDGGAL
jgi:DNA-binding MarR family transcriptional regulator